MENPKQAAKEDARFSAASRGSFLAESTFHRDLRRVVVRPAVALVVAMVLLLGLLIYLFLNADEVDYSNQVLAQISRVEKLAMDMETGVRGYRITADLTLLEPFERAQPVFSAELNALENLVRNSSNQVNEVRALREAHTAWSEFATNVRERVRAQIPADVASHVRGKALMDVVRAHIDALQRHERRLLARHSAYRTRLRVVALGAVVLSAIFLAPAMALSVRRAFLRVNRSYQDALGMVEGERERLDVTLSSIGDGVVATDASGRITYMNPVAADLTGWSVEEAAGKPLPGIFKIINEGSRETVEDPVQTVLRQGRTVGLANHTVLIAKDGRETPIADSAAPIRARDGSMTGVVLVFRDQIAERDAGRKVEWLASFPERNPNPVIELASETGEVIYANSFAAKIFPELMAKGLSHEFIAGLREAAQPVVEGKSEFIRREMSVGGSHYLQTICYLPDAKRLRVYCSDITATKKVEAALRHSRDQIQLISDAVPALISYVDSERRYQFCNQAYLTWFGLPREEIIGRTMQDVLGEDAWKAIGPHVEEALAGKNVEYEVRAEYRTGPRWIHASYTPHRNADGEVIGLVVMVTDIGGRKQSELLLDSQKHSLEMIVSGAPLSEVLTYLARIVEEQSGGKATASILLLDSKGRLRNGASPSLPADYLEAIDGLEPCANVGTCCAAAATSQVVLTPDIANDPKWHTLKHLPLNLGFLAAWSQPITSTAGRVLGTFGTYFRDCREPTAAERRAVEILARTAALAIERHRVEADRERFVSLAENSSDFIGMCGPDFLPFFVNRAGLKMVGLDNFEQARLTPVKEFFFPEDQDRVVNEFFPSVIKEGSGEIEIRFRHFKTGQALWMLYNVWVVNDDSGRFAGLATVSRDITDRKRAEEERGKLAAIVESSEDAIVSKDLDGTITSWNTGAERLFGYTAQEAVGRPITILIPPERLNEEPGILKRIRRGERIEHYETVRRRKDGKLLDISLTVSPIVDGQGCVVGASKIARDVTDRKRAEEALHRSRLELAAANEELALRAKQLDETVEKRTAELRETIQQLETFSYSIVHDMRAPLRSMRSFAGFLHHDYTDNLDDTARDYLRRIMESAARMDALITDVLNYSRVSRGPTDLAPVDLDRLVPEIIEQYPHLQEKARFIHVDRPLPKVSGNTALLTQVFSNLLGNALKFVADGAEPRVVVHAESNRDNVRVWVEDNGIGIPPEQRDRIFGLFQRLHRPNEYAGTGVGLAIVKRAVEKMGGKTGVESEPGQGSRFWIELHQPAVPTAPSHVLEHH